MLRRKGLFWYAPKKRFFDFSTPLSGHVFGYGDPYLNSRAKSALKKNPTTDFPSCHPATSLKSQFSGWCHNYPELNHYLFYLVSEAETLQLFSGHRVIAKPWEVKADHLLHSLASLAEGPGSPQKKLITDTCFLYPDDSHETSGEDFSLYIHSTFPDPNFLKSFNQNSGEAILPFTHILIGGLHPFGFNGQKLLLIRSDQPSPLIHSLPNHWHLTIYRDGIRHYLDIFKRPGYKVREDAMKKTLYRLSEWAQENKRELHIHTPTPLTARLVLGKEKKTPSSLQTEEESSDLKFHQNRFFYHDLTVIAEEWENRFVFYLQLPVNFPPQHLENKWKGLAKLFSSL